MWKMIFKKAFDEWFNEYFCDQQGEDSPYSYRDILESFKAGVKEAEKEEERQRGRP